jgi:hypothetical protein
LLRGEQVVQKKVEVPTEKDTTAQEALDMK